MDSKIMGRVALSTVEQGDHLKLHSLKRVHFFSIFLVIL